MVWNTFLLGNGMARLIVAIHYCVCSDSILHNFKLTANPACLVGMFLPNCTDAEVSSF